MERKLLNNKSNVQKMIDKPTKAWEQYEAGCDYKRRIGLYETVRKNERFMRGDQWQDGGEDLPKPVFNIIRRITDYMICTILAKRASIMYSDDDLPYVSDRKRAEALRAGIELMTKNAAYRWEKCKMDKIIQKALYDAAISGDGVIYSYFDRNVPTSQPFTGDIVTENIDNVNLFVADVNCADLQSQEYIILSGRQSVSSLRREAIGAGMKPRDAERLIKADDETSRQSGDMARYELDGDGEKATYIIKFWREKGTVRFEKSVRECAIRRVDTGCRLYPVAYFNWYPTKNSFHGTSPITCIIPNQKYINSGFAMAMKHMADTAFSKVIYDKTKIPEWTNRVGEAIAAVGATNVSDAVSVVGVGQMQDGYLELLDKAIASTKEFMGATETALGNVQPTNTSAILAIQEASKIPLTQVKDNLCSCIEDLANIWADMMCSYYPDERLVPYVDGEKILTGKADFALLRRTIIEARVEIADPARYSVSGNQAVLDRLLDGGHITLEEYLERLPSGIVDSRGKLIEARRNMKGGDTENDGILKEKAA